MAASGIEIKCLENPAENWRLLLDGYLLSLARNPMLMSIPGLQPIGRERMTARLRDMVQSANLPVIIAWDHDKQKVAGQSLLRGVTREIEKLPFHEQPGGYTPLPVTWDEQTAKQINNIFQFLDPLKKEVGSLFDRYPDIDRYAIVSAGGVLPEYVNQGLGSSMMEKGIEVLRKLNYPLLYGEFASFFSQRIADKFGFEVIVESAYEGKYLNYDDLPDEAKRIHNKFCIGIKNFSY